MPYTSPATVVTGTTITSAWGNSVKAATDFLSNPPAARARRNAALSHTSSTNWQVVTWDAEVIDTDNMWVAGSPTRLTITTAGLYLVSAHVAFLGHATGVRGVGFRVNGVGNITDSGYNIKTNTTVSFLCPVEHHAPIKLAAASYVEAMAYQNSGGNLAYDPSEGAMWFSAIRIGIG